MKAVALALALCQAGGLLAQGSTPVPWLGGTQPWDTISAREADMELRASGGDSRPSGGAGALVGLHDQVDLGAWWDQLLDGAPGHGEGLLKVRESGFPAWRPALGACARMGLGNGPVKAVGGLILALEPFENSLVVNVEAGEKGVAWRGGWWSPFLLYGLRLGGEAWRLDPDAPWSLAPQAVFLLPGDISLLLGATTYADGLAQWRYGLRLAFILFPSP